jgi:hypothetical protein
MARGKKTLFFCARASQEGYDEVVTVGMHWVGGALLVPKTVRTERHRTERHGSFATWPPVLATLLWRWPTRGAKCQRTMIALRHYFSRMYRYEI